MDKNSPDKQLPPGVTLLALKGDIQVSEVVLTRIDGQIRESVNAALAALWKSESQLPREVTESKPNDGIRLRGGLDLAKGEEERARNAKRGSLGLDLKEGQGMIDGKALAVFLDISYRALYRFMAEGALPEPVTLGGRMKRWSIEEVLAWVMSGCPRAEHWKRRRIQAIRDYRALSSPKGPHNA